VTRDQALSAVNVFEATANRVFGPNRVRQPANDVRSYIQEVFGAIA
jgi:hypothetical protein